MTTAPAMTTTGTTAGVTKWTIDPLTVVRGLDVGV